MCVCVCVLQAMCEAKPEEGRVDNLLFPKISTGSGCLCLWVPRGHGDRVLCGEINVLLEKAVIEPVPPADMKTGFYSPYFMVPKKSGGL